MYATSQNKIWADLSSAFVFGVNESEPYST